MPPTVNSGAQVQRRVRKYAIGTFKACAVIHAISAAIRTRLCSSPERSSSILRFFEIRQVCSGKLLDLQFRLIEQLLAALHEQLPALIQRGGLIQRALLALERFDDHLQLGKRCLIAQLIYWFG